MESWYLSFSIVQPYWWDESTYYKILWFFTKIWEMHNYTDKHQTGKLMFFVMQIEKCNLVLPFSHPKQIKHQPLNNLRLNQHSPPGSRHFPRVKSNYSKTHKERARCQFIRCAANEMFDVNGVGKMKVTVLSLESVTSSNQPLPWCRPIQIGRF